MLYSFVYKIYGGYHGMRTANKNSKKAIRMGRAPCSLEGIRIRLREGIDRIRLRNIVIALMGV